MTDDLCLPASTRDLLASVPRERWHPGLRLDKLTRPPRDQQGQKEALDALTRTAGATELLENLLARRARALSALAASTFVCETATPFALHLARAGAFENAGICLHPVYGFAYIPGSGLKGMARAYAETVWCPAQEDPGTAWRDIEAVFGWTSGTHVDKGWKPSSVPPTEEAQAGDIVFHEAWPLAWPGLDVDITNNHHRQYYQGDGPPGDWEDPNPVYFLTVQPATPFRFAVAKRRPAVDDRLLDRAREWLLGALYHAGAGAKTAAGYGAFRPAEDSVAELATPSRAQFETSLRLVSPAFLAGASQDREDGCDLRAATLRGLLRWWWRTLHAGHVDVADLRRLEAAVWGDTASGSPVAVRVDRIGEPEPVPYDKSKLRQTHGLERPPRGSKTTQGLFYASFGMDEVVRGQTRRRLYLEPGHEWRLRLTARSAYWPPGVETREAERIDPDEVLRQALAALWLFSRFGGAGSKSRKGFGSFADMDVPSLASLGDCRNATADFRARCGVRDRRVDPQSPSVEHMLQTNIATPWQDPWFALDQLGDAVQGFAKSRRDRNERAALGWPRWRGRTDRGQAQGLDRLQRHASPALYHLALSENGSVSIRVTAFPSPKLPDRATSERVLRDLIEHLESDLARRAERLGTRTRRPAPGDNGRRAAAAPRPADRAGLPAPNEEVGAVMLEEPTRKGGWKARHLGTGMTGPIQNTADVPSEVSPGDEVSLLVAFARPREIAFWWPTEARRRRMQKHGKKEGGRNRGGKREPRGGGRR